MEDKSALLGSLKIDRDAVAETSGPPWKWIGIAVAALVVIGLAWAIFKPDPAVPVNVVTARAVTPNAVGSASVLDASGYVVARRQATVSSKVTGKVLEVSIEEGSRVEEGQVLARIDDSNARMQLALAQAQLAAAHSALAEVKVELANADREARRARELAAKKLVSQAALESAQAKADGLRARLEATQSNAEVANRSVAVEKQMLDDTIVRAPFAGVITVKNAQPGEMISPLSAGGAGTRTGIGTLVDMKSLEVEVDVNENFINRVQPGQPTETILNAYPDWKIPSEVIAVIPTADRSKATVKVRVRLRVEDPRVIPDMGARVSFLAQARPDAGGAPVRPIVLVPTDAVRKESNATVVFLVKEDHTVERRAVTLGSTRGSDQEITAGLNGGESLASGEIAKLADGTKIKLAKE